MKQIIPPVEKGKLEAELTPDKLLRYTNYGGNQIYLFDYHDSPNLLREVGRLREVAFRAGGGGTGKELDIDQFDTAEIPYKQLIVWDPSEKEILGGYRYIIAKGVAQKDGAYQLATARLLNFSKEFIDHYLPYTIELGRSFVQPIFQSTKFRRRALFALDNLWDGLGALAVDNPTMKYLFGKVTMYSHFNRQARDLILFFLKKFCADPDKLIRPVKPLPIFTDENFLNKLFSGNTYQENYKILSKHVRATGKNIPPLINAYIKLSPSMKTFGTALNTHFGDVEETGIMVTINDIYPSKKERHITSYLHFKNGLGG